MNECRALHETALKDVLDIIDDINNSDIDDIFDSKKRSPMSSTSIARITSNMTLVFPVIVSRNISIQNAMMAAKAIERKAMVMLQMLFSAYQITDVDNLEDFIGRFHSNIKMRDNWTVDDAIGLMDRLTEGMEVKVDRKALQAIKEDMKNLNFYLEEDVNPVPINSYSIRRDSLGKVTAKINEDLNGKLAAAAYEREQSRAAAIKAQIEQDKLKDKLDAAKVGKELLAKQLLDSDIKKANELVPSTLVVSFMYKTPEGTAIPVQNVVLGVKARMIPMESNDIITHFMSKVEDKKWLLQFLRATTRETSFMKDFLFAIDKAKVDALSRSRRGSASPMWKVLERRSMKGRIRRFIGRSNDANAITTVVISQEEVDYVRKEHNVNFEEFDVIGSVMESYNLMGFVILDESLEVAKFLFDTGEAMWENLAFSGLERENNNGDYKKIVNLMTKMAR